MDYIQEDVDGMNKELETWKRESENYARQEEQQQAETQKSLAPLISQLKEIEEGIEKMMAMISIEKSGIIANDALIGKLLSGITNTRK
jgi:TRAF3-interacting protein 1